MAYGTRTRSASGATSTVSGQWPDPLPVGVGGDAGRRDGDRRPWLVPVVRVVHVGALEQLRVGLQQLSARQRLEPHDVEQPVVEDRALGDPQAAAERRAVAHGDQGRLEPLLRARRCRRRTGSAEGAQLGHGREVVAHLALGPGHLVGPLVDDRVEAGGQHGDEVRRADPGEVDGALPPADHDVGRRGGVLAREVEVAGHVVAGARWHDAEPGARPGHRLDGQVDHPVAADHDEGLDAVGHAAAGEVERLVGVAPDQVADVVAGVAQPGQHLCAGPGAPFPLPDVGLVSRAISRVTGAG